MASRGRLLQLQIQLYEGQKNNYWLPHSVTSVNTFLLRTISSLYGKEREVCWSQKKRIIQDKCQSILLHSQIHSLLITSTSKQPEASQASIVAVGNIVTPVLGGYQTE